MLKGLLIFIFGFFHQQVRAELQLGAEWIHGIQYKDVQESTVNPSNRVAELETLQLLSDFRGDFKYQLADTAQLTLRPRMQIFGRHIHYSDTDEVAQKSQVRWDLSEAFGDFVFNEYASISIGLQSYQWGPAELASPTNPIFHFDPGQKSYLFKEKGKVLSRLNLSAGESWSLILMQEFIDNKQRFWIADRDFEKKTLAKLEYRSSANSNRYMGLVGGQQEAQKTFAGAYFNMQFADVFSVYADGRISKGQFVYYPQEISSGVYSFSTEDKKLTDSQGYSVVGFRWEGDWDFRLEYLYNSSGYDRSQIQSALQAVQPTQLLYLLNLNRFTRSGLDFLGQRYVYASIRISEIGKSKEGNFYLRYFQSLQDDSASLQSSFDQVLNDMLVGYLEGNVNFGSKNTELKLLEVGSLFAGLRLSW